MATGLMPAVFLGHGSPMNALDSNRYIEAWRAFGASVSRPGAILAVSAHLYVKPHPSALQGRREECPSFRARVVGRAGGSLETKHFTGEVLPGPHSAGDHPARLGLHEAAVVHGAEGQPTDHLPVIVFEV